MKSTKMRFEKELIPSGYLTGILQNLSIQFLTDREPSRPAVAPFSSTDQPNDAFVPLHIVYPPEIAEDEDDDEVMMDFVSGK